MLVGVCRRAGFEPKLRNESFHTGWDLLLLPDVSVVALAPASVASGLAQGVVAVPLEEPTASLETRLLWQDGEASPTLEAFRSTARAVYQRSEASHDGPAASTSQHDRRLEGRST